MSAINVAILSHINSNYTQRGPYVVIFVLSFFCCVGYLALGLSTNVDQAIAANKMCYFGASFLPMFTFHAILLICEAKAPALLNLFLGVLAFAVFGLSFTVGYNQIFYTSIRWEQIYGVGNYVATFGPGHMLFNFMLVFYVVANVSVIVYAFFKKNNVSYKHLTALALIEMVSILSFVLARFMGTDTLIMPAVYLFDQYALLYICYRVRYYDITQAFTKALEENNSDGYISVLHDKTFLCGNKIAYSFFEDLKKCRVDTVLNGNSEFVDFLTGWVDDLKKRKNDKTGKLEETKDFHCDDKHYKFIVRGVHPSKGSSVYLFNISDNTELYNYVQMLGSNNLQLESIIKSNAEQIHAIQQDMIIGMANMVENRDSNTGGHIKRTSQVVAILVDELRKENILDCDDKFFNALVKSAPMHDLGKIAVDDAILRKPGRFTPEEYEIMKTHPFKGATIVENLLSNIEEPEFTRIAKNLALSHHERYDGKGYPNGLKGEEIPIEARIMAIADVYDALVSRRCYKEKFSFDTAYEIVLGGMGTQFDPELKECFINCRERLEAYYSSVFA
ncbi:MAG: HD domain-containing protein [Fibrobacter sp.]|nr:HD domain-containing protein [Fibrobacter sp.]